MSQQEIIVGEPVRTAIGAFNGTLKGAAATELGAVVITEVVRRAKIQPDHVQSVTMGNVVQAGNRMNPARQASIRGGLSVTTPALTINRVCGSGAQAIVSAAQEIMSGNVQLAIAGGMENMDRAPYLLDGGRWGYRMGPAEIHDSMLRDGLIDAFSGEHSGWHTEDLVTKAQLTRERQDRWAERSQKRFAESQVAGLFEAEIVPVKVKGKKGDELFSKDEASRPDTTYEALAKLRPAFRKDGTITAGNAPGLNSGASAMIVSERSYAEKLGISPWARLVSYGIAAVEPGLFGLGPVPAVRIALERAGWKIGDIDRIEINEAFAAVPLAVAQELQLPEDIINVEGGAIAHGHPIGATGAVLTTRLLHAMRRNHLRKGIRFASAADKELRWPSRHISWYPPEVSTTNCGHGAKLEQLRRRGRMKETWQQFRQWLELGAIARDHDIPALHSRTISWRRIGCLMPMIWRAPGAKRSCVRRRK